MTLRSVGLVLCSSSAYPIPSTRIAALNMRPFLAAAGWQTCVLFEPPHPSEEPDLTGVAARAVESGCEVVILQKVRGPSAVELARRLSAVGVRTVYVVCDYVDLPMVEATDATIVVTEYLRSLCPPTVQSRIYVVHDGIERPMACKSDWGLRQTDGYAPLHALLVTSANLNRLPVLVHPPAWLKVRVVGRYAQGPRKWREIRWTWAAQPPGERLNYLRFLMNRNIECVPWDPAGVYDEMLKADIAVIPIDVPDSRSNLLFPPAWKLKSENRLTLKMSMGLPVIATPIPAYEPVIRHGINGFFARSKRDWEECLTALRDPARRREMGLAARASVAKKYSMEEQASKLIHVVSTVCGSRS